MSTLEQSITAMKNCRKKCLLSLLHIIMVPGSSIGYCYPSSPNTITPQLTSTTRQTLHSANAPRAYESQSTASCNLSARLAGSPWSFKTWNSPSHPGHRKHELLNRSSLMFCPYQTDLILIQPGK